MTATNSNNGRGNTTPETPACPTAEEPDWAHIPSELLEQGYLYLWRWQWHDATGWDIQEWPAYALGWTYDRMVAHQQALAANPQDATQQAIRRGQAHGLAVNLAGNREIHTYALHCAVNPETGEIQESYRDLLGDALTTYAQVARDGTTVVVYFRANEAELIPGLFDWHTVNQIGSEWEIVTGNPVGNILEINEWPAGIARIVSEYRADLAARNLSVPSTTPTRYEPLECIEIAEVPFGERLAEQWELIDDEDFASDVIDRFIGHHRCFDEDFVREAGVQAGYRKGRDGQTTGYPLVLVPYYQTPWFASDTEMVGAMALVPDPHPRSEYPKSYGFRRSRDGYTHCIAASCDEEWDTIKTVILCEGAKDALALAPRVPDTVAVTSTRSAKPSRNLDYTAMIDKRVVIVADCDAAGREGATEKARRMIEAGVEGEQVYIVELPYDPESGKDARDYVIDLLIDAEPAQPRLELADRILGDDEDNPILESLLYWARPYQGRRIELGADEHRINAEAGEALADDPDLYRRAGEWVAVMERAEDGQPEIHPLREAVLQDRLSRCCFFYQRKTIKSTKAEEEAGFPAREVQTQQAPPKHVVKYCHEAAANPPGARDLLGIVSTPTFRADGSLIVTPGYDPQSKILLRPQGEYPGLPEEPTREQATAANDALAEVVRDFPFASEADYSAWLALVFTLIAREMIDGPTPLFLIHGNRPGVGKGLLVKAASIIGTKHEVAPKAIPRSDEELRKWITSLAISGARAAALDNVTHDLAYPSMEVVLTSTRWNDRILGGNRNYDGPWRTVLIATANHAEPGEDTRRRTQLIRLLDRTEDPSRREVEHTDLVHWLNQHQTRMHAAAVTAMRAYVVAGMPRATDAINWGSYEAWSRVIRGLLVWLGLPDPYDAREGLVSDAAEEAPVAQLITAWDEIARLGHHRTAITATTVRDMVVKRRDLAQCRCPGLRDAIKTIAGPRANIDEATAHQVGRWLSKVADQNYGGRQLTQVKVGGIRQWVVGPVH